MRTRTTTATILLALSAALAICSPVLAATSPGGSAAPAPSAPPTTIHTTGIATWFGPGFYGQETACGQTLTPTVIGVANRTLPCGTLVKVTYKGHSVTVPVLDRGPYSHAADWDLTAGAAEALGVSETVRIGTRIVGKAPNTAALGLVPTSPGATTTATAAGGAIAG